MWSIPSAQNAFVWTKGASFLKGLPGSPGTHPGSNPGCRLFCLGASMLFMFFFQKNALEQIFRCRLLNTNAIEVCCAKRTKDGMMRRISETRRFSSIRFVFCFVLCFRAYFGVAHCPQTEFDNPSAKQPKVKGLKKKQ
jgi:hypothetical protein